MKKDENQELIKKIELAEDNITNNVKNLFNDINKKAKSGNIPQKDVLELNKKILEYISNGFMTIKKDLYFKTIDTHIESKYVLNNFTSEDIEKKNIEITKIFQNEAFNRVNDDEEEENQSIADFFLRVAKLARIAFNTQKELLAPIKKLFFEYKESEGKNYIVKSEEDFKREFSCWVKEKEEEEEEKIESKGKENVKKDLKKEIKGIKQNNLNLSKIYKENLEKAKNKIIAENDDKQLKEFLSKIFDSLTLMYFHCYLSIPLVEINFDLTPDSKTTENNQDHQAESNCEESFNYEKMIDFINKGKNRKVNFVILPSLVSNKNYLKNGKFWVFTYLENTFKYKKSKLESIEKPINSLEKSLPSDFEITGSCEINEKNKKKIITIIIKPDIYEKKDFEFKIYLKKEKNTKEFSILMTQKCSISIDKEFEISKAIFKIENKEKSFDIKDKIKE